MRDIAAPLLAVQGLGLSISCQAYGPVVSRKEIQAMMNGDENTRKDVPIHHHADLDGNGRSALQAPF
jgi:hypothetical protein